MSTAVCIPAAGRGERLGTGAPKALRLLAGEPLLVHAVRGVLAAGDVPLVVVAAPPGTEEVVRRALADLVAAASARLEVVTGGATRPASVAAMLDVLQAEVDVVLVHDAARPLTPPWLVDAVVAAVRGGWDAVVPGLPLADTVKLVDVQGVVVGTPARAGLRAVQTPQGFRREVLDRAYADLGRRDLEASTAVTDDAGLVELIGTVVHVVPGAPEAFKVTTPLDLVIAEHLLAGRTATTGRA